MQRDERWIEERVTNGIAALFALAFAVFLLVLYAQMLQAAVSHAAMRRYAAVSTDAVAAPREGGPRHTAADAFDLLAQGRDPEARAKGRGP